MTLRVDVVRLEVAAQNVSRDAARRNPLEVFAWAVAADAAVGSRREGCLIYDRVAACGLNALLAAPFLWKDMVNVDVLVKVTLYRRLFTCHPVSEHLRAAGARIRLYMRHCFACAASATGRE